MAFPGLRPEPQILSFAQPKERIHASTPLSKLSKGCHEIQLSFRGDAQAYAFRASSNSVRSFRGRPAHKAKFILIEKKISTNDFAFLKCIF